MVEVRSGGGHVLAGVCVAGEYTHVCMHTALHGGRAAGDGDRAFSWVNVAFSRD